ncbi:MAG: hypothetical protein KatS3mg108_2102 [Isosphaeraceae bacterium]|nr:MAG: hypothetical protein KatS3mg108_2102 [Isosphaeraceae bacterium]
MNLPAVFLGVIAGIVGGMFGVGGGLIIVPCLILLFGFGQKEANGTSLLAQLLPVASFAVWEYWRNHQIQVMPGLSIAAGLLLGTWIGSRITLALPPTIFKQVYGLFLIAVGLYFVLSPAGVSPRPADPPSASSRAGSSQ